MPYAEPLSADEIGERLAALESWTVDEGGRTLQRTYRLDHLAAAILAVHIAKIQAELDHHSDLTLGYDTLRVEITTHAAGGRLTEKDFGLADRIAAVAPGHGAR
ncbi:4a-hydroxytetrahydrobiopterin dehydratase [Streptomyces sp. NBC_00433]